MDTPYQPPAQQAAPSPEPPLQLGIGAKSIFIFLGCVPISAAILGWSILSKFWVMYQESGIEVAPFPGLLLWSGGVIPTGLLAILGLGSIAAAVLSRVRWLVILLILGYLGAFAGLPAVIDVISRPLEEYVKQLPT
jgi:hypothetical protein